MSPQPRRGRFELNIQFNGKPSLVDKNKNTIPLKTPVPEYSKSHAQMLALRHVI